MNKQEIFDTAVKGLRSQGFEKSMDHAGMGAYRGVDGLRCAIGHLISDNDYDPAFEGWGVHCSGPLNSITRKLAAAIPIEMNSETRGFLSHLQGIHDGSIRPEEMKEGLAAFAEQYNLDPKEIYE